MDGAVGCWSLAQRFIQIKFSTRLPLVLPALPLALPVGLLFSCMLPPKRSSLAAIMDYPPGFDGALTYQWTEQLVVGH
jgi:hypothetical protein